MNISTIFIIISLFYALFHALSIDQTAVQTVKQLRSQAFCIAYALYLSSLNVTRIARMNVH